MALSFLGWTNMSAAFVGVAGAQVTAVPWSSHFALFATDAGGQVFAAGGDPQSGLMGPWAPMSDAFSGIAGARVSVVRWGKHFALFATDASGVVRCAGGDPQNGLMGPWAPMSDAFAGIPGAPVTVLPWGDHFALFATDATGAVMTAGGDPQNGLMGPWASVSEDFSGPSGATVAAIPWAGAFAVCAVDSTGTVRAASGDPQNNLSDWTPAVGLTAKPGSAATIVPIGTGAGLFVVDTAGAVFATGGGEQVMTTFTPGRHGWHFDNDFVNHLLGGVITTKGLCGGMAYSSLDYYFNGIPIPTHREGDFGESDGSQLPCPPDGRLRSMIFNRLLDSFKDNFDKWSCVYPELDAAVGAALGLVFDGGLIGGLIGAVGGWVYGELHEAFACPGGGAAGMTRQELPHLIKDFLDKGVPAPIGLIYDRDILNIGLSHQVVAYGYAVVGGQTVIYVYDNRYHDQECILTVDTAKPGKILETFVDGSALPDNGNWEGLLVSDGYQSQTPSYGQDIGISSPQALRLSGPIVMAPIVALPGIPMRINGGSADASPTGATLITTVPQQQQLVGRHLVDTFAVQNFGEFQAHYRSLGVEIDAPDGRASLYAATAAGPDNLLAPGQTMAVAIEIDKFGDTPGIYALRAGYNSVPALTAESSDWQTLFFPAATVTVTRATVTKATPAETYVASPGLMA